MIRCTKNLALALFVKRQLMSVLLILKKSMKMKLCTKCKERERHTYGTLCKECSSEYSKKLWASLTEVEKKRRLKEQRKWYASNKSSVRKRVIELKYDLTEDQFNIKLEEQDFRCGICNLSTERFFVDHDHSTGKTRGLLCHHCNLMLGMARDKITTLRAGAKYLEKYHEDWIDLDYTRYRQAYCLYGTSF